MGTLLDPAFTWKVEKQAEKSFPHNF